MDAVINREDMDTDEMPPAGVEQDASHPQDHLDDIGDSGDAPSQPQDGPENKSLGQVAESEELEATAEPMETEEPPGETAEGTDQVLHDMGEGKEPEFVEQENEANAAHFSSELLLVLAPETGDEDCVIVQNDESGLTQENAGTGENQEEPSNEAVANTLARETEDSIVVDTGDEDFSMSAEDEDKLLAEDNTESVSSLHHDSENAPAVDQDFNEPTVIRSSESELETDLKDQEAECGENENVSTEKTDLNACSETVGASGNSPEAEESVENQSVDDVEGDRKDTESDRTQDGNSTEHQNPENTAQEEQDLGQHADTQEQDREKRHNVKIADQDTNSVVVESEDDNTDVAVVKDQEQDREKHDDEKIADQDTNSVVVESEDDNTDVAVVKDQEQDREKHDDEKIADQDTNSVVVESEDDNTDVAVVKDQEQDREKHDDEKIADQDTNSVVVESEDDNTDVAVVKDQEQDREKRNDEKIADQDTNSVVVESEDDNTDVAVVKDQEQDREKRNDEKIADQDTNTSSNSVVVESEDDNTDVAVVKDQEQDREKRNDEKIADQDTNSVVVESEDDNTDVAVVKEEQPMLQVTEIKSETDPEDVVSDTATLSNNAGADSTSKEVAGQDSSTTTSTEANSQSSKPPAAAAVVDDDDDDVVVLDDDEVTPVKVKQEKMKKEVFDDNNDMGIQIASVSGGADELHKMAEQNQVKQENGGAPVPQNVPPSCTAAPKKAPSKTQSCIVCRRVGKCKYNIVRNGDIKHLCDDTCFKRFRSNPTMFLKSSSNKPAGGVAPPPKDSAAKMAAVPSVQGSAVMASVFLPVPAPTLKTCVVCQIMNVNNQSQFCVWKGMDFCGEGCLGKYQSGMSTSCTLCKTFIPLTARSSNCLRLGNQIHPFCSTRCYSDYKLYTRLCTYCHSDLGKVSDSFSAPVGPDSTFKEFCSQTCMKQFESLLSSDVEIIKVLQGNQRSSTKCSVCGKVEKTKHAIKFSGVVHNLCSDPCLMAFRYANKLDLNTCDSCKAICSSLEATPHTVVFEGNKKRFCSDACVSAYRVAYRKVVHCSWCGSQRDNFDMIERLDSNSKYQMFCSLNCLSLFRVNLQAKSNQAVVCDHCRKMVPAQYHLTMSDASVRNFCSYNCVMSFQSQFSKGTVPPPPPFPSITPPAPTHKHNTRRSGQLQSPAASSLPVITNVMSLASQGQNIPGTPAVVSRGSPGTKPAGELQMQQQIIVQPPPPKVVKNKALMCKPFTQTKATSCRPHVQNKECQTDEVCSKPVVMPVPVPVYLPTPMALYSAPAPTPVFIPVPIPVPIFIPTTRKSANGIMKQIEEIRDKTPSDPLEAELLQMAAAVSAEGNHGYSSDTEEETTPMPESNMSTGVASSESPVAESRKRRLSVDDDDNDDGDNGGDVLALSTRREDGEEDMISMALRMAEEITDLESAVEAVPVNTEAPTEPESSQPDELKIRRITRRNPRSRPKRQRVHEPTEEPAPAMVPQEPTPSPADHNFHLKFSYGVNAWRHWVMFKNTQLEQNKKIGFGRVKLFKTDILQCTAEELNFSLCLFVKEVRKPSSEEYSADSIYYLTLGLQQYLYENGRIDNIFADHYFEPFTQQLAEILTTCEPKFNSDGQMVCRIEEEHLWECKQLGAHSPYVLLNTLMYFHTKFFLLKTPEDHLKLSFAHILKYWKKGGQQVKGQSPRHVSLRYYSISTAKKDASATLSTTKRGSRDGIPVFEVMENAGNPLRCPVKLYEFFLSKCPESIKNRSDIFYPVPERSCVPDSPVWYSTKPLGEEVLTRMLTRILLVREIQEAHLHARPAFV